MTRRTCLPSADHAVQDPTAAIACSRLVPWNRDPCRSRSTRAAVDVYPSKTLMSFT